MNKDELLDKAREDAQSALVALDEWRKQAGRDDPMGRGLRCRRAWSSCRLAA